MGKIDSGHGKRIVSLDGLGTGFEQHERGGDVFPRVLAGLLLQIPVQGFMATTKSRQVVFAGERLNDEAVRSGGWP